MNKPFDKQILDFGVLSKERGSIMGIAALMIVVFHFSQMSSCFSGLLQTALSTLCGGVEIFILMSGVGLYYSFQNNNNIKPFYIKRICNVYLISLIITLPYMVWWSLVNQEVKLLLVNWLAPNYILGCARDVWYVPFIMVMYLIYPAVYKFLFNEKIYKYRYLIILVISILWYIACFILYKSGNSYFQRIEIAFFRFPFFLMGCLVGELVYKKKDCKKTMAIAFALSFFSYLFVHKYMSDQFGFRLRNSLASIVYLILIVLFLFYTRIDFIHKVLTFFGKISLELYLTHLLIFKVLAYYGINEWIYYLIASIGSVIISYPLSKLRGKFVELSKKRLSPKKVEG